MAVACARLDRERKPYRDVLRNDDMGELEIQKIIARRRVTSLILMIPAFKSWRVAKRGYDLEERIQQLREEFRNTEWDEKLTELNDFSEVRAILFRADGSIVLVRSRSL